MEIEKKNKCMWFAVIDGNGCSAEDSLGFRTAEWISQSGVYVLVLLCGVDCADVRKLSDAKPYISMLSPDALRGYLAKDIFGLSCLSADTAVIDQEVLGAIESSYDLVIVYFAGNAVVHLLAGLPALISIDAKTGGIPKSLDIGLGNSCSGLLPVGFSLAPYDVAVAARLSRKLGIPSWGDGGDVTCLGEKILERAVPRPINVWPRSDSRCELKNSIMNRPTAVDLVIRAMRNDGEFLKVQGDHRTGIDTADFEKRAALIALRIAGSLSIEERGNFRADEIASLAVEETIGFGPITALLRDGAITEIMVNGCNDIFVETAGAIEKTPLSFIDTDHLMLVIERMLMLTGRRLDEASPMVDARLSDGSRLHAIIPPLAIGGAVLTIRKFAHDSWDLCELVNREMLPNESARFLAKCVLSNVSIVVSGGTGTGKTTLLGALASEICDHERIITIEDAAELRIRKPNLVRLESRPPNIEGAGGVAIRELVRNALRMRPDRIVVGECRGAEAVDMLQAMNTGHEGSLTTVHANSPRDAISRLETMVLMAGLDLPLSAVREQIARAVKLIVQVARIGRERRVVEISEITGMEGQIMCMQTLAQYDRKTQRLVGTGLIPRFAEDLRSEDMLKLESGIQ